MASFLKDNDSSTSVQSGEKNHTEYAWSNSIRERILQFSFQTTRTNKEGIEKLSIILRQILSDCQKIYKNNVLSLGEYQDHLITLYKMIGHTRDIVEGKGEYAHAYMQIVVWYEFFPELALFALKKFVIFDDNNSHPYGSWKDIKYFCLYCKEKGVFVEHPLMQYAFELINTQVFKDYTSTDKNTLACKWVAREKGKKFGWIFDQLAYSYFAHYLTTAKTPEAKHRAKNKCKMDYRKMCSVMNKELETTQVFQCANQWAKIDHTKTTSITISKQKHAFLNIKKNGEQRTELEDRIMCANNFKEHIKKGVSGEINIKGKRVGLNNFTTQAFDLILRKQIKAYTNPEELQAQMDLLNLQWRDNARQTDALCEMIPMCDFSGSMDGDPRDACFALGIRIAEKSILGKRVLSFSNNPTWHNLDHCNNFIEMVEVLQKGEVGFSTQFYKALKVILDAIIERKLTPEQVSGLVLAILSDMQIDQAEGRQSDMDTLYETIEEMYADAGMRLYGEPFKPPHILFWNLRSTSGFPCLSSQNNVSMMSGFSPALLNLFCEKGLTSLQNCTPWTFLTELMNKPRYKCLEDKVKELVFNNN